MIRADGRGGIVTYIGWTFFPEVSNWIPSQIVVVMKSFKILF